MAKDHYLSPQRSWAWACRGRRWWWCGWPCERVSSATAPPDPALAQAQCLNGFTARRLNELRCSRRHRGRPGRGGRGRWRLDSVLALALAGSLGLEGGAGRDLLAVTVVGAVSPFGSRLPHPASARPTLLWVWATTRSASAILALASSSEQRQMCRDRPGCHRPLQRRSRTLIRSASPVGGRDAVSTCEALIASVAGMPTWLVQTLTWDQAARWPPMLRSPSAGTIDVFFAHPHCP